MNELYNRALAITEDIELTGYASVWWVAAALRTNNWNIFTWKCLELSCGIWFCAEHSAIAEMLKTDISGIAEIIAVRDDWSIVSPCGRCREMMMQIHEENKHTTVYLSWDKIVKLSELIPHYWR